MTDDDRADEDSGRNGELGQHRREMTDNDSGVFDRD
jgi:hypothetical protein